MHIPPSIPSGRVDVVMYVASSPWSPTRSDQKEDGVQAYGGSYSSVTASGSIRYELGVMRFSCNEIARRLREADFGTDCFKVCSCERLILRDMCISGGQESIVNNIFF